MKRCLLAITAVLLVAGVSRAAPKKPSEQSSAMSTNQTIHVIDFQVPQYDEQGVMTSKLRGKEANIFPDRMTAINELLMEIYRQSPTGRVTDVRVTSPQCYYHPDKGFAVSEETIRIARENMVVTGSNYVIDAKAQRLQINHDARVVLKGMQSKALEQGLVKP